MLIVGTSLSYYDKLKENLQKAFGEIYVEKIKSTNEAITRIKIKPYDVIISNDESNGISSLEFLKSIRNVGNMTPFIILVDEKSEFMFSKAFSIGVNDIIERNANPTILILEIINSIRRIIEFSNEIQKKFESVRDTEEEYIIQTEELEKRLWESNFLYSMPKILNYIDQPQEKPFPKIIALIKETWKNANILSIRIKYEGKIFKTNDFSETKWKQASDILAFGEIIGSVEVFYQESTPAQYETVFLIEALTREISKVTERIDRNATLRKLSRAVEQNPSVIYLTDREGRIEWVNPRYTEVTSYLEGEIIGKFYTIFTKDKQQQSTHGNIIESINKGEVWKGELLKKKKNRESYWVLASVSSIRDDENSISNFVIIEQDITEMKRVLDELNKSEQRNRAYVKAIPDLMFRINKNGIISDYSIPEDYNFYLKNKLLEFFPETSRVNEIFPRDISKLFLRAMKTAFSSGESLPFEFHVPLDWTNNEIKAFETRVVNCGLDEVLVIVRDITDKKEAEEAFRLREAKEKIEVIIDTMADGILVLDPEGKKYLTNQSFEETYLHIFNKNMSTEWNCSSLAENLLEETIYKLYQEKKYQKITIEPIEGFNIQLISSLPQSLDLAGFLILTVQDITPFVKFDKMVKQFISTASHELRTPISVIIQSLNNLKKYRETMSEEVKIKLMDSLDRNANLMFELVNDLLLISRIDEKRIILILDIFNPAEKLTQIISQLEPKFKKKKIKIHNEVSEEITIYGDSMRLNQVFRILIDNAIKYSHRAGKVLILAHDNYIGPYNPKNLDSILFEVRDYGIGINKKDRKHIFDRFFRSNEVRNLPGTGLGLSIAKEICILHGGEMYFKSEHGSGSSFFVLLQKQTENDKLP